MEYKQSPAGAIYWEIAVSEEGVIRLVADRLRNERTGVHARLSVFMNSTLLAYSNMNIEKDEDRTRLANSAAKQFSPLVAERYPAGQLKHDIDRFCWGLWDEYIERYEAEVLDGADDVPVEFYLEPYILKGGGTILFAPPGRGKSYLSLAMAISVDAGLNTLWRVQQTRVLFINLERSRLSVRRRIGAINKALGLPYERPLLHVSARGRTLADIAEQARKDVVRHGVGLVVLDSISRTGYGDLTENVPANRISDTLNGLCDSWLAIGHTPRQDSTHLYGSVHFEAAEDIGLLLLTQQTEDGKLGLGLQVVKANDIAIPPLKVFALEFNDAGLQVLRTASRSEFPEIATARKMSLADEVEEYLRESLKATATEIAQELKRNRSNVSTVLNNDLRFIQVGRNGTQVLYGLRARYGSFE